MHNDLINFLETFATTVTPEILCIINKNYVTHDNFRLRKRNLAIKHVVLICFAITTACSCLLLYMQVDATCTGRRDSDDGGS